MPESITGPGVYVVEQNAFPTTIVPVPTGVPAFIGYTQHALRDNKPVWGVPTKISSFSEYRDIFGGPPVTKLTVSPSQHPGKTYELTLTGNHFTLHHQMKLFFDNGGADCYVVAVNGYGGKDGRLNEVKIAELSGGLKPLLKETEPTLLVVPDLMAAVVVRDKHGQVSADSLQEIHALQNEMLAHCAQTRSRFAILDVWMDRENYQREDYEVSDDISRFRKRLHGRGRDRGAAYYPYLQTTVVPDSDIDVRHFANPGTAEQVRDFPAGTFDKAGAIRDREAFRRAYVDVSFDSLTELLDRALNEAILDGETRSTDAGPTKNLLREISRVTDDNATGLTQSLSAISPTFRQLTREVAEQLSLLPPGGALAGIYAMTDASVGVWQAPANVGVASIVRPAVAIEDDQQEDMNAPPNGIAVNALRAFPGRGVLVWGARTLDGNSQDWRYVSVRRTMDFIEQSVKLGLEAYVFDSNTQVTWTKVKTSIAGFLTELWRAGALAGATPEDAFDIDVGLGVTMTPVDILDGYMRVTIKVAVTRPAEFIVLTLEQKMQSS